MDDAAEGVVAATELYDKPEPVNLGSGMEISIRELATMIAEMTGFTGGFDWNALQPNGQPRRRVDTSRAEREFGFRAQMPFEEGVRRTIEWYERERKSRDLAVTAPSKTR